MCGIAGIYNFAEDRLVDKRLLKRMCDVVQYRGPDDAGIYVDGKIGLGHRRLSIIDLSTDGKQPMSSIDDKIWIVFNGEIYNFLELRANLEKKGYKFKSKSDTEVIIYLYQEYGEDCLKLLRGMFAFAIWDSEQDKLFIARDRIGQKPLFYYLDDKRLVFASEIKSILEDKTIQREINLEAFCDYLKYLYIPAPKTIYKNIYKLLPGHYLVCTPEKTYTREYWDVSFSYVNNKSEQYLMNQLLDILTESVKYRLISDVPLGAFLSGGIDSSAVVALMSRIQNHVIACSIGFDDEEHDGLEFARCVAQKFDIQHYEKVVRQDALNIIEKLVWLLDEPFADSSAVPTYYVSKLAREEVTVALSGDGGDENLAGYHKYYLDSIENRLKFWGTRLFNPNLVVPMIKACSSISKGAYVFSKAQTLLESMNTSPARGFYNSNTFLTDNMLSQILSWDVKKELGKYDPFNVTEKYYNKADTDDHLSKIQYVDLKTYLPGDILVKVDRMSMANSLEVRSPFLDHKVIEFAATIPSYLKLKGKNTKFIFKKSLETLLPEKIIYRKKKGFTVPLESWFKKELKEYTEDILLSSVSLERGFFNAKYLKQMWNNHQKGYGDSATNLWALLMFELWYRRFISS